ncbi:hypothetical protein NRF20_07575 [Streptomyces sp. R-74717]|uniref:hypothetical protein n=1 Tax=Streptomyces TaxID=1883 RepID=UPI00378BF567
MSALPTQPRRSAVRLLAGIVAFGALTGPAASLAAAGEIRTAAPTTVERTARYVAAGWPTLAATPFSTGRVRTPGG